MRYTKKKEPRPNVTRDDLIGYLNEYGAVLKIDRPKDFSDLEYARVLQPSVRTEGDMLLWLRESSGLE